ncbi:MAG: ExeA family protein [Puniceicoccaceae bacterium]
MYLDFYRLETMPFNITPNPDFLFLSPSHEEALQHLRYGISERKGFIVVVGEVGCGKTTICRQLLNELDPAVFDTVLIVNTRITENELLRMILNELGETEHAHSRTGLTDQINEALLRRIASGREIVLVIDEAQNLRHDVLEQIRLLSNLEADDIKLMQIILFGQPELKAKLREESLRQLRQRILVYHELRTLTPREVREYVSHRLQLAGSKGVPIVTSRAFKLLAKKSRGIPRILNNLCDKALLCAFTRESDFVTWWDVRRAAHDLEELIR